MLLFPFLPQKAVQSNWQLLGKHALWKCTMLDSRQNFQLSNQVKGKQGFILGFGHSSYLNIQSKYLARKEAFI